MVTEIIIAILILIIIVRLYIDFKPHIEITAISKGYKIILWYTIYNPTLDKDERKFKILFKL